MSRTIFCPKTRNFCTDVTDRMQLRFNNNWLRNSRPVCSPCPSPFHDESGRQDQTIFSVPILHWNILRTPSTMAHGQLTYCWTSSIYYHVLHPEHHYLFCQLSQSTASSMGIQQEGRDARLCWLSNWPLRLCYAYENFNLVSLFITFE